MQKLLRTEWLKLKSYNAFIILTSLFVLSVFVTNYIVYVFNRDVIGKANTAGLVTSFNPYSFEMTWQTTSYATGWLLILPALILIILVTNEFTYRTNRQNIIDGWSRQDFINVKIALAVITALGSAVLVVITALIFASFSGTSFSLNHFSHVGYFFLKALSYNLLAVLLSVWLRRTGFAIGLYFIYVIAENGISQLLDVWSMKLRREDGIDLGAMGDYLPMNASDGLLTFPENSLKSFAKGVMPTDYTWLVVILALSYVVLFFG